MKPCDHPVDIALLRALMFEAGEAYTRERLAAAVSWLGDSRYATTKNLRSHLDKLVKRGLVRVIDDPVAGRKYAFVLGSSVQLATGGIDPTRTTPDELLTAYAWRSGEPVEFDSNAHKTADPGLPRNERALRQCNSPWQYAQRLARL